MSPDTLNISCPAKINLALSVGAPHEVLGYHPICSWMVAVDFYDTLILEKSTDGESTFNIRLGVDAPLQQEIDWSLESDLTFRSHLMMEDILGRSLPVNVQLIKNIPSGAGLGGGSGNAAAMLVGLNHLFDLKLDEEKLAGFGGMVGSDVAFMVMTQMDIHSAIVTDIGENIEACESGDGLDFVLILPDVSCPTGEVYEAFDQISLAPLVDHELVRAITRGGKLRNDAPFNDLTEAAFEVQPTLRGIRDQVQKAAGIPAHLSGSGSAMFVVVGSPEEGEAVAWRITEQTGIVAICVRTLAG